MASPKLGDWVFSCIKGNRISDSDETHNLLTENLELSRGNFVFRTPRPSFLHSRKWPRFKKKVGIRMKNQSDRRPSSYLVHAASAKYMAKTMAVGAALALLFTGVSLMSALPASAAGTTSNTISASSAPGAGSERGTYKASATATSRTR